MYIWPVMKSLCQASERARLASLSVLTAGRVSMNPIAALYVELYETPEIHIPLWTTSSSVRCAEA